MKLRTIAIDDEPLALQLVEGYIDKTPFMENAGCFESPLDALEYLSDHRVDLAFVDIEMPDLKGNELASLLRDGPRVIFTTAYEQYALEGYKLDVVDYLLKPFSYEEFLRAGQKALKMAKLKMEASTVAAGEEQFLFVKSEYKLLRIDTNKIRYIEGLKDYVKIYLDDTRRPILSLNSMKNMESNLPASKFMRVHRSYIINLDKINSVDRNRVVIGEITIVVGSNYKEKFTNYLDRNFV